MSQMLQYEVLPPSARTYASVNFIDGYLYTKRVNVTGKFTVCCFCRVRQRCKAALRADGGHTSC